MAKLTVYIPDELLERARARDPSANTSQLVQRGLEQLSPSNDVPYARRPADADKLLAEAREKLNAEAALEYERGYRRALDRLSTRGDSFFYQIDELARMGFDMARWLKACARRTAEEVYATCHDELKEDLGSAFLPPWEEYWVPTDAFVKGYGAALREAWEGIQRPTGHDPDVEHEKEVAQET